MLLNHFFESFSLLTESMPVVEVAIRAIAATSGDYVMHFMCLLLQIPPSIALIF